MEKFVFRAWISTPALFNENDDQIEAVILTRENEDDDLISNVYTIEDELDVEDEGFDKDTKEDAALYGIAQKIVQASDWDGNKESKFGVIKCLTEMMWCMDKESSAKRKHDSSSSLDQSGSEMSELTDSLVKF